MGIIITGKYGPVAATMTQDAVNRRAGGRRRYNADRQLQAALRRRKVLALYERMGGLKNRGVQSRIAEILHVNRSTVCRDLRIILPPVD